MTATLSNPPTPSQSVFPLPGPPEMDPSAILVAFQQFLPQLLWLTYQAGAQFGNASGYVTGYTAGSDSLMSAISDGFRHGSPQCAKAMRARTSASTDRLLVAGPVINEVPLFPSAG